MTPEYFRLPAEALPDLRRVLAFGLASFAEIQRVQDAMSRNEIGHGIEYGNDVRPALPTADAGAVGKFAGALMWLDIAEELPE